MRKSISGLMSVVQGSLGLDPFEGNPYVFCIRKRNSLKILEWDGDGFWPYFKRLKKDHFKWPQLGDESIMTLNETELAVLLGGVSVHFLGSYP